MKAWKIEYRGWEHALVLAETADQACSLYAAAERLERGPNDPVFLRDVSALDLGEIKPGVLWTWSQ